MAIYESKEQADKSAQNMIKELDDPEGWEAEVWQNSWWCCCIRKGGMTIYSDCKTGGVYRCYLNVDKKPSGSSAFWYNSTTYDDINKAIANQIKVAREFIAKCTKVVDDIAGPKKLYTASIF